MRHTIPPSVVLTNDAFHPQTSRFSPWSKIECDPHRHQAENFSFHSENKHDASFHGKPWMSSILSQSVQAPQNRGFSAFCQQNPVQHRAKTAQRIMALFRNRDWGIIELSDYESTGLTHTGSFLFRVLFFLLYWTWKYSGFALTVNRRAYYLADSWLQWLVWPRYPHHFIGVGSKIASRSGARALALTVRPPSPNYDVLGSVIIWHNGSRMYFQ